MRLRRLSRSLPFCFAFAVACGCTPAREGEGPSPLGPNKPLPGQTNPPPATESTRDTAPPPSPPDAAAEAAPMPGFNPPPMPMPMPPPMMPMPMGPVACTDEQLTCNESKRCTARVWGFETGFEGWTSPGGKVTSSVVGNIALSEARPHGGGKSIAAPLEVRPYRGLVTFHQNFCGFTVASVPPLPSVSLRGKTASAWVYLERASGEEGVGRCFFVAYTADDFPREVGSAKPWTVIEEGNWFEIRTLLDEIYADRLTDIQLECQLRATSDLWTGTLYVDDVKVE